MASTGGQWRRVFRPRHVKPTRTEYIETLRHKVPPTYYFPNIPLTIMATTKNYGENKFVFKVRPQLTKIELKDYVSKLYDVTVKKINTMNYEAQYKRSKKPSVRAVRKVRSRFKKAIVTIEPKETDDSIIMNAPSTL